MHLIRNVDCFGREFHFLIHHKQLYQSVIGGILSIIVTMVFIFCTYFFGKVLWERTSPLVMTSTQLNNNYEIFNLTKHKVFFAFKIEDLYGKIFNFTNILYIKLQYFDWIQRTTGKFARSARLMQDLKDIVTQILEISEIENDYESAKNCIILSQTFYIDDKDHNKIYLFESIIDNKWLTSTEFWYGVIECMIDQEFQKNESSNKEINAKETEEEKAKRISNIAFSQVLPYTNNMLDFKMDKNVILEVINSFVEKYKIESDFAEAIINNVKERNYN